MTVLKTTPLVRSIESQQDIIAPGSPNTYTLPSSGVKAGYSLTIYNNSDFLNTVNASGGLELTTGNGSNLTASGARGYCELVALQDTPTTPAHWFVKGVYEEVLFVTTFTFSSGGSGTSVSNTIRLVRNNKTVTCIIPTLGVAANVTGTPTVLSSDTTFPARLAPSTSSAGFLGAPIKNNGTSSTTPGPFRISSSAGIQIFRDYTSTAWSSGACGLSPAIIDFLTISYTQN